MALSAFTAVVLAATGVVCPPALPRPTVHYDFEHPVRGNPAQERDIGRSGTHLDLVNGGPAMRVRDGAYRGSRFSLETRQVNPDGAGNDDWKAGRYAEPGVPTLRAFNAVRQVTITGWFKLLGPHPAPNTNTADPADFYDAVGLAGVLSGDSDGHRVRALLEVFEVDGALRVVALGRRVDGGASQTYAANADWQSVLPVGTWVFLAATFDFDDGTMALYRNGRRLDGFYATPGDPWAVTGPPEPDLASATDPRGIKIGGSFPQNTRERNPCTCRFDDLRFFDRALSPAQIRYQYRHRGLHTAGPA